MTAFHIIAILRDDILYKYPKLRSKEKKLLAGFLAGRERVQEEVKKSAEQGKLF